MVSACSWRPTRSFCCVPFVPSLTSSWLGTLFNTNRLNAIVCRFASFCGHLQRPLPPRASGASLRWHCVSNVGYIWCTSKIFLNCSFCLVFLVDLSFYRVNSALETYFNNNNTSMLWCWFYFETLFLDFQWVFKLFFNQGLDLITFFKNRWNFSRNYQVFASTWKNIDYLFYVIIKIFWFFLWK